jgi:hypothetical protein
MANTYVAIATITVGSGGASSISFSNIPSTYTDLKLVFSLRTDNNYGGLFYETNVKLNSTASSNDRLLFGYGTTTGTNIASYTIVYGVNSNTATASSFGNGEIYIPNYTSSSNKHLFADSVSESNAAGAIKSYVSGNNFAVTSAVTSITLAAYNNANYVQHSTATLYGIKKS